LPVEVLTEALLDESKRLGAFEACGIEFSDLLSEKTGGMVRQGHRQLGRAPEQSAKSRFALREEAVVVLPRLRESTRQFPSLWPIGKHHTPTGGVRIRCRDDGLGRVTRGKQHHPLRRVLAHIFPAVCIAGLFDEGAFAGIHSTKMNFIRRRRPSVHGISQHLEKSRSF